jgi:acyl carrier protein
MGLDTVELVLAIEEEFGVPIDDNDAAELTTPGQVTDYLFARLDRARNTCSSQARFYRLRRALVATLGVRREEIRVDTRIDSLLPKDRRRAWDNLRRELLPNHIPRLERHPLLVAMLVLALPGLLMLSPGFVAVWPGPSGFGGFVLLSLVFNVLSYPMGSRVPRDVQTLGALVPYIGSSSSQTWSRQDVLERVMELTAHQLGLRREEVGEHSHFVRDLGAD